MPRVSIDHLRADCRPLIYGHRGASARAPENTLRAFTLALDEGADGVELDVHVCASGEVVVVHDADLKRVAGVDAEVARLPYATLRGYDVGEGEHIPLLDDVLDLVIGRNKLINVEVKADGPDHPRLVEAVAQTLQRRAAAIQHHVFLSTFHPGLLARLQASCSVPIALLFDIPHTGQARAEQLLEMLAPEGAHPQRFLAQASMVHAWHQAGRFVNVWTLNDPGEVVEARQAGVDGLITDRVREVTEWLT